MTAKLSPLLKQHLYGPPSNKPSDQPVKLLRVIIEVSPQKADYIFEQLKEMGFKVNTSLISQPVPGGSIYIPAVVPASAIPEIQRMPGVVSISKSMPMAIGGAVLGRVQFPFAVLHDELLGDISIPGVELPNGALQRVLHPLNALKALGTLLKPMTGFNPLVDVKIFTTAETAKIMKDAPTNNGKGVAVAILDTGSPRFVPQFLSKQLKLEEYTVIPEPPQDQMAHGSWCHDCVCGGTFPSPYGKMTGMAPDVAKSIHVKVLNTFPGSGSTEGILKGIEIAVKHGARVISMSLGGPAQGNEVNEDPGAKVINQLAERGIIFSIAMGNSGPHLFTGGSPGVSLKALTVGSVSIMDKFQPAWWSSRGPGSGWDGKHRDDFEKVLKKYGDEAIKPDVTGLGGGRASKNATPDEVIWSGENGWFESFYDGIKDATGGMHGTSQATPHVAGVVACLLSDGVINNVDDVKKILKETANDYIVPDPLNEVDKEYIGKYGKSIATGWGLLRLSRFKR